MHRQERSKELSISAHPLGSIGERRPRRPLARCLSDGKPLALSNGSAFQWLGALDCPFHTCRWNLRPLCYPKGWKKGDARGRGGRERTRKTPARERGPARGRPHSSCSPHLPRRVSTRPGGPGGRPPATATPTHADRRSITHSRTSYASNPIPPPRPLSLNQASLSFVRPSSRARESNSWHFF